VLDGVEEGGHAPAVDHFRVALVGGQQQVLHHLVVAVGVVMYYGNQVYTYILSVGMCVYVCGQAGGGTCWRAEAGTPPPCCCCWMVMCMFVRRCFPLVGMCV
jgi:hypothetical protein